MTEVAESVESLRLDELKELVEEAVELSKENNKLLKRMRRDAVVGGILKFVVWLVLIVGSFYLSAKFLEPYLGMLQGAQGGAGGTDWQALYNQYKGQLGQ